MILDLFSMIFNNLLYAYNLNGYRNFKTFRRKIICVYGDNMLA